MVKTATFASGCFWCTEALFKRIKGIHQVTSGYTGGDASNPSYGQVSSGRTGHAEGIQATFDPDQISYEKLLDVFFATHDPTTKDQQGADIGTQYRSAIFYHSPSQKTAAENKIRQLEKSGKYSHPIVTEIREYQQFYPAEEEHQDFYSKNPKHNYCIAVIDPKITKLLKQYKDIIKPD